jgi:hypothetical protein
MEIRKGYNLFSKMYKLFFKKKKKKNMVFLFTRSPEEGLIPETCRSRSDHPARYIHIKKSQ